MKWEAFFALWFLACVGCGERARRDLPNVLLVTIDTARRDRFGAYGGIVPTPAFDALAAHGTLFERAVTPSPITWPSHASIFTGLYPLHHGVHDNGTALLHAEVVTIAEILRASGYSTLAFVGSSVLERGLGCERGFDQYNEIPAAGDPIHTAVPDIGGDWWERPAEEVNAEALRLLRRCRRPFFAWCHYFEPHAPYRPPPPFAAEYSQRPYDGEIAAADAGLGKLLAKLEDPAEERGLLIIVLADHGECLGEHGGYFGHAESLHEEVLAVPALIAWPGRIPPGARFPTLFRTIDLFPTLLDLLDLPVPPDLDGVSRKVDLLSGSGGPVECIHETSTRTLLDRGDRRFVYRVGPHKVWWTQKSPVLMYSTVDAETGWDVFLDKGPEETGDYEQILIEYVKASYAARMDAERREMEEALRRLGY